MAADRVQEPEGRVSCVVFDSCGIAGVDEHALRERPRRSEQQRSSLGLAPGLEEEAFVRGHRVAGPIAEPRVAGDDRRARHDELIRRHRQETSGFI